MANGFCDQLDAAFLEITKILNTYSKSDVLQRYFFQVFESLTYANLINIFFSNLTTPNLKNYDLSNDCIAKIDHKYKKIRKDVQSAIHNPFGKLLIDSATYDDFKRDVKSDFPEVYALILKIEEEIDIEEIRKYLENKAEEIKKTGKSRDDFHSSLVTTALESFVEQEGYFPTKNQDKIFEAIDKVLPDISEKIAERVKQNIDLPLKDRRQRFHELEARRYARWREPLDFFESLIGISLEVGERHYNKLKQSVLDINKAKFTALVQIHARACRVSYEILELLKAGYPDGAFARWRTMNELAVVAFFLKANEDPVSQRYLEHEIVLRYKQAKEYQDAHLKLGYPPIDEKSA